MAATQKLNICPYSRTGNATFARVPRKIAASQSDFIGGCPFYVSTSGTLKKSDSADGSGDTYHFISLDEATSELSANAEIYGYLINIDQLWNVFVENNDADAAATQALVGNQYGLRVATGAGKKGYVTMDVNNSSAAVEVIDIWPNIYKFDPTYGSTSDSPGIAVVRFLASVINVTRS